MWAKVEEEIQELRMAFENQDAKHIEEEFGDLLFSLVNYARHIGVHPESALRGATEKFQKRFLYIEDELSKKNVLLHDASLDEMNMLWEKSKEMR